MFNKNMKPRRLYDIGIKMKVIRWGLGGKVGHSNFKINKIENKYRRRKSS